MNILITGGTGLIGRALSAALAADGHQVSVLTRNPDKARNVLVSGVLPLKWQNTDIKALSRLIEQNDAVINLAGESIAGENLLGILTKRWTDESKKRIQDSRVDMGETLVKAIEMAEKKPQVFIQASAVGYYGVTGDEPLNENEPKGDDFLAETCKLWEDSTVALDGMGIRRVIIRTGLVLDAKSGILPIMLLPFRLFAGGKLGSGEQYVPWIHLEDEVNAIRFLFDDGDARGAYNLSAPQPVKQRELAKIAGRLLRRPSFIPAPAFALQLALGEKSTLVLDGQRAIPEKLVTEGFSFSHEDFEAALKTLI
ncbi:MAG: TIGR01777 family protein [Anaerolineae bacterium]|jgi:uncharacterized protein|nr:TIGR01777 family protein [Anaerolineae bacterium]MBT7989219.1 TIGR01777 family protein [Anaerolineae bacterium]